MKERSISEICEHLEEGVTHIIPFKTDEECRAGGQRRYWLLDGAL